mgnify:CR=1 FL=1
MKAYITVSVDRFMKDFEINWIDDAIYTSLEACQNADFSGGDNGDWILELDMIPVAVHTMKRVWGVQKID